MVTVVLADAEALAQAAADFIAARIAQSPALSVLVATGNTPMGAYAELGRRAQAGQLDASHVTAVQLDEYLDVPDDDPRSLWSWMNRSFLTPLGIQRVVRFQAHTLEPAAACRRYVEDLAALGPLDLSVLGLGPNGHLGFNEPPSAADAPTRVVPLSDESRVSNAAYWSGRPVPDAALTAGMDVILAAREQLLLVSGAHKHGILQAALRGPVTPDVPASFLQGTALTVMADAAAWTGQNP